MNKQEREIMERAWERMYGSLYTKRVRKVFEAGYKVAITTGGESEKQAITKKRRKRYDIKTDI